jgi:hypothetical protein
MEVNGSKTYINVLNLDRLHHSFQLFVCSLHRIHLRKGKQRRPINSDVVNKKQFSRSGSFRGSYSLLSVLEAVSSECDLVQVIGLVVQHIALFLIPADRGKEALRRNIQGG